MAIEIEKNVLFSADRANTRTQRTDKPFARFVLLTGYTPVELKFKFPALTSDEYGELLQ